MIASIVSILIYIGMIYYGLWDLVPQEHRWWLSLALIILFLYEPVEKNLSSRQTITKEG